MKLRYVFKVTQWDTLNPVSLKHKDSDVTHISAMTAKDYRSDVKFTKDTLFFSLTGSFIVSPLFYWDC